MATAEIRLTMKEITYLSDALSMFSEGPSKDVRAYPELLLKIGAAFLEVREDTTIPLVLVEDELWMVRETAKSGAMVGPEKVGLNLMLKVYAALRAVCAQGAVHAAVMQAGDGQEDEPARGDRRERIEEWKKGEGDA